MSDQNNKPKIRFRNYTPYDQSLLDKSKTNDVVTPHQNQSAVGAASSASVITEIEPPTTKNLLPTTTTITSLKLEENPIEKELLEVKNSLNNGLDGSSDLNIVPKKINWDLKRHIEPKIEKLRKRTQRAIVEILKEKLSKEEEDLGDYEQSGINADDDDE